MSRPGPRVTVWVQTFNHERWIDEALDGVVAQECPFLFEVVAHDDASTDDTQERVRAKLDGAGVRWRAIFHETNQYSTGARPLDFLEPGECAEYIAILEGDDAWCDPSKLAEQVAMLDAHPQVDLCFHRADVLGASREGVRGDYGTEPGIVSFPDVLHKRSGDIPTASLVIRREAFARMQVFCRKNPWIPIRDAYLQAFGAERGGAAYVPKTMALYRKAIQGSWTERQQRSDQRFAHYIARIRALDVLADELVGPNRQEVRRARRRWVRRLFTCELTTATQRRAYLREHWRAFGRRDRLVGAIGSYAPATITGVRMAVRAARRAAGLARSSS